MRVVCFGGHGAVRGSDVQGFVNPPRVRGKGQKGKGQGKDFLTLDKPLTLVKGQGFSRGFSGVSFL